MARADDEATRQAKAFLRAAEPKACSKCGRVREPKGTPSKGIINTASFARLVRAGFDARPSDVPGSYAAKRDAARRKARLADAGK